MPKTIMDDYHLVLRRLWHSSRYMPGPVDDGTISSCCRRRLLSYGGRTTSRDFAYLPDIFMVCRPSYFCRFPRRRFRPLHTAYGHDPCGRVFDRICPKHLPAKGDQIISHMSCSVDVMRGIGSYLVKLSQATIDATVRPTIFQSKTQPEITIAEYVIHLQKYGKLGSPEFVVALIYVKRISLAHSNFHFTSLNLHRILIAVLLVATKMLRDIHFSNRYYAKVGGVATSELCRLERCVLELIDFRLYVSTAEYNSERVRWATL
jgi:hypothetical protein